MKTVLGAKCTHERARAKKKKEKKKHSASRPHEREELEVIRCNGVISIYVAHVRSRIQVHVTKPYNISSNKYDGDLSPFLLFSIHDVSLYEKDMKSLSLRSFYQI